MTEAMWTEARDAYDATGSAWSGGPELLYVRLAEAMFDRAPDSWKDKRVLDVGAGTGATSRLAAERGSSVVELDGALGMLRYARASRPPAVVADARLIPIRPSVFDAAVAAFLLNHVDDPSAVTAAIARTVRPGGFVLASTFSARSTHPAKEQVDRVAAAHGWARPAWYDDLKGKTEPLLRHPEDFAAAGAGAGLTDVRVEEVAVQAAVRGSEELVRWRLGMAHLAPFVATLSVDGRRALVHAAREEVGEDAPPYDAEILVLFGRVQS